MIKIKEFLAKFWENRFPLAIIIIVIGILDLIGITSKANIGVGFILGFLLLFAAILVKIIGKDTPKKE